MNIDEIERAVQAIRAKPLQLIGITPTGERCIMSVRQCVESKAKYLHIVADELDALLGVELGGDADEIAENRRFPQTKGGEALSNQQKKTKKS